MSFQGMFVDPDHDPRNALPPGHGEKAALAEYLDRYRMTLELKCEALSNEQLATRSVPPSTMSLLGLIRHLALVEHHWTRHVFEGRTELPWLYRDPEDPDSSSTRPSPSSPWCPTPGTPGGPRSPTPARSIQLLTSTRA